MADELSDMDVFSSITSGDGSPDQVTIEPQEKEIVPPPAAAPPRDATGRFAKAAEPEQAATPDPVQQNGGAHVPTAVVKAERERRQEAQQAAQSASQENETLRRELAELRGQISVLSTQRQPQPQPQPQERPIELWDDPQRYIESQLQPVNQTVQLLKEDLWESRAQVTHGVEKVKAAKEAAEKLFGTPEGQLLGQRIANAPNPFSALVDWHQQQETLSRIGNDPDAFINAEIQRRLSDPNFLAQAMERARSGAASNPAVQSQQQTNFAPSLSRIPSGGNGQAVEGDQSDGALFSSVTSGRRK